ncbi:putative pentatricopeptide repeat-containing protein At5g37570 isoform X1 [Magnolia sinica]|uniref:putative pentatricopeptide repeat-containing protein At5g37570 isoform X1 n=1 Tax=Magnolia sinica TaxID=86752 RepID=UPI002657C31C|nr:putative pentatricopeptide repeat-containing protein At5g37570 isoform X1 [Magnolia sinica]XP_058080251.1 putative pentatricopeptide repeat-containing protein At5g37570 isoform X1 [Magnolia sinica]XP_058080252.1 putative pentatricopeptide repeat-containing protein At5g37570 isoform X1 [Magnolia sinica]XP_058080253.1 putative pentatricopeptide repeat-containing protein At5g37570 isoform X1 [Magnolia sinica]
MPYSDIMAWKRWNRVDEERIVGLLSLCRDLQQPKQIHAHLVTSGQSHNNFLLTKLIRTLADFGSIEHARCLFNRVDGPPSVFLWTAMIRGYSSSSNDSLLKQALLLYSQMHRCLNAGDRPLNFTLSSVLKACAGLSALHHGLQVHTHVVKYGFYSEPRVQTTLIHFYSKCGCIEQMKQLFDKMSGLGRDVQAWNTVIAGYTKLGDMQAARSIFDQMPEKNVFTWVEMITGYANSGQMDCAYQLVDTLLPPGDRDAVVCTAMIAGYAKCGDILAARMMFDKMTVRDVASWNAMITAYSQAGLFSEALHLFHLMLKTTVGSKMQPNRTTMATIVSACAQLGSAELARWIEDYINSRGRGLLNVHTVTALIDMHAKCGDPDRAYELFQSWKDKDVICYSSMIEGFGVHGRGKEALRIFRQLQEEGLKPDSICFIGILSACSHAGLVDEGCHYFESMRNEYLIPPTADHYMCMVDLLGRSGRIEEAYRIITTMVPPVQPHAGVWGALLNACRIHSNSKLGEKAAWHLLELEPENAGNYVLLSNMYAKTRRWEDVAKVRALMRKCGMRKPPGCSWIEVEGNIHRFLVADVWDIRLEEMLELLRWELKTHSYLPSGKHVRP